jgi:hypothetical protein
MMICSFSSAFESRELQILAAELPGIPMLCGSFLTCWSSLSSQYLPLLHLASLQFALALDVSLALDLASASDG